MKIENEVLLDFDDVLIKPKRSIAASRAVVKTDRDFFFYHSPRKWAGLPIMAANMSCTGSLAMSEALEKHKAITCLHKFHKTLPEYGVVSPYEWISTGIEWSDTLNTFVKAVNNPNFQLYFDDDASPNLCIDVANGYTDKFVDAVKKYRQSFKNSIIMAGNVATPEMVHELIKAGADIVKVGIGPGKACQTRMVTGVGVPQLSAIAECADAAHGLKSGDKRNGLICADGGISSPADACKAFGAGADFVMLGSLLAGTSQCEGEWTSKDTLKYYGMSSYAAQENHYGHKAEYRATEGKVLYADYKGSVDILIKELVGGIRSCCAYIGADSIRDLSKCCTFLRVSRVHRTPEWRIE